METTGEDDVSAIEERKQVAELLKKWQEESAAQKACRRRNLKVILIPNGAQHAEKISRPTEL